MLIHDAIKTVAPCDVWIPDFAGMSGKAVIPTCSIP